MGSDPTRRKKTKQIANSVCDSHSYNRYLAVAARVVRRSLKEEKRLVAERRGQQELRFAKWSVSAGIDSFRRVGCRRGERSG